MSYLKTGRLILVRHGESIWNLPGLTRFTGWADIPLSNLGRKQAEASGRLLSTFNLSFDAVFTSLLIRSRDTYDLLSLQMDEIHRKKNIPVVASWRLNERHYGALVGLSKAEAEISMGKEKVMGWRRSWDLRPPPMDKCPSYHSQSSDPLEKEPLFDWQSEIWTKAITITKKSEVRGFRRVSVEEKVIDEGAVIPRFLLLIQSKLYSKY